MEKIKIELLKNENIKGLLYFKKCQIPIISANSWIEKGIEKNRKNFEKLKQRTNWVVFNMLVNLFSVCLGVLETRQAHKISLINDYPDLGMPVTENM